MIMKRLIALALAVCLLFLCGGCGQEVPSTEIVVPTVPSAATTPTTAEEIPPEPTSSGVTNYENVKAIWLSQYDLWDVYLDGEHQRNRQDFTERMGVILSNIRDMGFNTVFLQVRPNGDSMYPSQYYPMSKYVVGTYGAVADYDPVLLIVELAKERQLSIHAWINPMRCMKTEEMEQVSSDFTIRQWYEDPEKKGAYLVQWGSYWYLNPAYPEVRELIADGAAELLARYDFDGLHMDDYFYPTTDAAFDQAAYKAAGEGRSLETFRRDNLNALVTRLYAVTKSAGEEKRYGISPAGNIQMVYQSHYADVYTWCSAPGYVDYICPQVYFGLEHQTYDFVTVCNTWQQIIQEEGISLIIGMTMEKAFSQEDQYAGSGKEEWKQKQDVLKRCLQYTMELPGCRGVSLFSYQHFYDPVSGEAVRETEAERNNFLPLLQNMAWASEKPLIKSIIDKTGFL